jgi:putative transposase
MKNNLLNRKKNRLAGYDYSQDGMYFITICTNKKENFFGKVENGNVILNELGSIVEVAWKDLVNHHKDCFLDEFIVMPNHIHGIIIIQNKIPVVNRHACSESIGSEATCLNIDKILVLLRHQKLSVFMGGFKSAVSKKIHDVQKINKFTPYTYFKWQKSFYDHIIRNQKSLKNIRLYIKKNPINWNLEKDRDHVMNIEIE